MTVISYNERFRDVDSKEPNMVTAGNWWDEWSVGLYIGKPPKQETTTPPSTAGTGMNMTTLMVIVAVVILVIILMKK